EIARAAQAGEDLGEAIMDRIPGVPAAEASAWRSLAAAWTVAVDSGASLAPTLRRFARTLRTLAQIEREIAVALAAPAATARLVMTLPGVGVVFGLLLGFDTARVLLATPVGWTCLAVGAGLLLGAARWNRH